MKQRFFAFLLALSMVLSMLPSPAAAAAPEAAEETFAAEAQIPAAEQTAPSTTEESAGPVPLDGVSGTIINPLYGTVEDELCGVVYAPRYYSGGASAQSEYLTEDADVLEAIASGMEQRKDIITFKWKISESDINTDGSFYDLIKDAFDMAQSHTGDPARGDYLSRSWSRISYRIENRYYESGYYYLEVIYQPYYYTTAQQEAVLTAKLEEVMASFGFTAETDDYTKIKTIYDYICDNVVYDYANLENEEYILKYTAYAALINGTAVCQGYALLLYRMLLMAGVDNRLITGIGNGGGHAWNIVLLDDCYYNLDSTWDAGDTKYDYFLKCPDSFSDHTRSEAFDSAEFHASYPMAVQDYVPVPSGSDEDSVIVRSGSCGENVTWSLTAGGKLTISGKGAMEDYSWSLYAPWHSGRSLITKVKVGDGVTHIGDYSFFDCAALTDISLPDSVTTIGISAFRGCTGLTGVTIPRKVQYIDQMVFANCNSLTTVTIPDSVTAIGVFAFEGCYSLTSVTISDSVTTIGISAFANCRSLTALTIPDSVTTIGSSAFEGCSSLTVVTISDSVTTIDYSAFASCTRLRHVFYTGTADQWAAISMDDYNNKLTGAKRHNEASADDLTVTDDCTQTSYYCGICHSTLATVNKSGHNYGKVVTAPTCTEQGYTTYTCAACGDSYVEDYVDAKGHRYTKNRTKEPTHTEVGTMIYTCIACGVTKAEDIPVLPDHQWGEWADNGDGTHGRSCPCGASESQVHRWGDWVELESNSCQRSCAACGTAETLVFDTPVNTTPDDNAAGTVLGDSDVALIDKVLTDDEQSRVAQGTEIEIYLKAEDISGEVSPEYKRAVEANAGNSEIGMYLDISLFKQVGDEEAVPVSETSGKVTVTITIPEELLNSDPALTRTYTIVRVHEEADGSLGTGVIEGVFNPEDNSFTFETDKFSTYALAYVDGPTVLLGDVNMDGFVDSMDTNILFRYANEDPTLGELTALQLAAADANGDGFVDSMDTNILFRYANEDPTLEWRPV